MSCPEPARQAEAVSALLQRCAFGIGRKVPTGNRAGRAAGFAVDLSIECPRVRDAEAGAALAARKWRSDVRNLASSERCLHLPRSEPRVLGRCRRRGDLPAARTWRHSSLGSRRKARHSSKSFKFARVEPNALASNADVDRADGGGDHREAQVARRALGGRASAGRAAHQGQGHRMSRAAAAARRMLSQGKKRLRRRSIGETLELARLEPQAAAPGTGLNLHALDRDRFERLSFADRAIPRAHASSSASPPKSVQARLSIAP